MIKLQDLTPEIYYKQSRDFQFIGRLYDIVLNSVKTNAANLYNLPVGKSMDEQLLNLLALSLGFVPSKNYNSKQLLAICSSLPTIIKHKGSIQALVLATNSLLAAEGVKQPLDYTLNSKKGITLYVAQELNDLNLLIDLLDYLLPAGLSCMIVKESQLINKINTTIAFNDVVTPYIKDETELSTVVPTHQLEQLLIGRIGDTPSILSNISIIPDLDNGTSEQSDNNSNNAIDDPNQEGGKVKDE